MNDRILDLKQKMWAFCCRVEPHQASFKVGYEARYLLLHSESLLPIVVPGTYR